MIAEFAIVPDVFDQASYSSPELAEVCLERLFDACRTDAIVRDLFDGAWSLNLKKNLERWHPATKEIIETLGKERRLCPSPRALESLPEENAEWCHEAVASNKASLDMIVAADPAALGYEGDDAITLVARMHKTAWWQNRSSSVPVQRQTAAYLKTLRPILKRANAFMFVDPHIDERESNYAEFCHILRAIRQPTLACSPRIEIHIWQGKELSNRSEWEARVHKTNDELKKARLSAEVFVWPVNFHDRYLVTDIVGISLPNGFDIDTKGLKETYWTRLGRKDREKVELNFEPNAGRYGVVRRFQIGD